MKHLSVSLAVILLTCSVCACSSSSQESENHKQSTNTTVNSSNAPTRQNTNTQTPNLTGTWSQRNPKTDGVWLEALVHDNTISIHWVHEEDGAHTLYWKGSFEAPQTAGDYTWVSQTAVEKDTESSQTSRELTKTFRYSQDGTLHYTVTTPDGDQEEVTMQKP
ncbi:hypothetical protein ACN08Z_04810 [Rothia sp. P7181]|uniref:hypothetical protein n=1 Tax=unclassified Rothia (in: high G+C Gram-positive bacteria) TaxID=2689056 RepID=UPI003AD2A547